MAFGRGVMSGRFPSLMLWGSLSSLYICFRKFIILYIFFSSFNFINFLCNTIFINVFLCFDKNEINITNKKKQRKKKWQVGKYVTFFYTSFIRELVLSKSSKNNGDNESIFANQILVNV